MLVLSYNYIKISNWIKNCRQIRMMQYNVKKLFK